MSISDAEELALWFKHVMTADQRATLMAERPLLYARIFPEVNKAELLRMVRESLEYGSPLADEFAEVESAIRQGSKLRAIKAYRNATGASLVLAKDAVEAVWDQYQVCPHGLSRALCDSPDGTIDDPHYPPDDGNGYR